MSDRSVQADVVKKAVLKYKASKLRGTTGSSVQGPKAYKDFYVVFRAISGERKELEIFNNERRFHEGSPPKLLVDLNDAVAIHVMNGKRSEFYVELNDGGMCLFEAKNPEDSLDWVSCLNAVLFAKGPNGEAVLQYDVELQESEILTSQGPAILELRDGELIISRKDNNAEIVKWRLSHIRSFKAKKRLLTIFSGSRSSTGVGEFFFKSERSVEITHAIETVVGAMAKDKKSTKTSKTHLSRPPIQNGQGRNWSSSVVDSIPDFQPPVVYEDIPETDVSHFDAAGYGKLNFKDLSPPTLGSPEHEGDGPGRRGVVGGARHTSPTPRPTLHHAPSASGAGATRTAVPPPARRTGRRDYEDLDLDEGDEEQKHGGNVDVVPPHETYSRLEREKSPARRMSPPDKPTPYNKKSSGGGAGGAARHGPPLPSRPHIPPPSPKPSDVPTDIPDGLYASINKPKKPRAAATVHSSRPVPPSSARIAKPSLNMHSGSNPDLSSIGHEEYGKLDRRLPTSAVPLPQEEYNTLDLVTSKMNGGTSGVTPPPLPVGRQEEYGKLEHITNKRYSHGPHIAEQYGKLEVSANLKSSNAAAIPPSSHYEMQQNDDEPIPPPLPSTSSAAAAASIVPPGDQEAYGRLHQFGGPPPPSSSGGAGGRNPAVGSSRSQPYHPAPPSAAVQEEYGRLERPMGRGTSSVPSTPEDEYGHLEMRPRTSSFNPYGTLSSVELKATNQMTSSGGSRANIRKHTRSGSLGGVIGGVGSGAPSDSQLVGPPPGYENTEIKQPSLAYRASIVGSQLLGGRPQAPPRGASNSPPLQKKGVHGYVNVDEKGQVKKPIPPTKPHLGNGAPSSRTPLKSAASADSNTSSSHDPSLKSHDMNGAAFPVRRKPIIASSDYEDTESLEFGMKPPILQKQKSTSDAVMPPPAPRRGPSIRNAISATNVAPAENSTNLKPSVAPKPKPKLKVKPVN